MQIGNYTIYSFEPLYSLDFYKAYPNIDREYAAEVYDHWLSSFQRRSDMFYNMQLLNVLYALRSSFRFEYRITDDHEIDYDSEVNEAFEAYLEDKGYYGAANRLDTQVHNLRRKNDGIQWVTMGDVLAERRRYIEAGKPPPHVWERALDRLWFDTTFPAEQNKELRRMPYAEYLKTPHWRRLWSGMILIHRARCQSQRCVGLDGYWNDEPLLHVHHMTYANRSAERYDDLRLLCNVCHEAQHNGQDVGLEWLVYDVR